MKRKIGLNIMSSVLLVTIVLSMSLLINVIMFWYSRRLTQRLSFIYSNIEDVSKLLSNYRVHLKSVYQMEMFYGDETLKFLMDHTVSISKLLEDFEDQEFFLEEFEESEEDPQQQEEQINAQTQINEENVFYAGTRKRDS